MIYCFVRGEGWRVRNKHYVAGYLCHLAADEDWKQFGWNMLQALEIPWARLTFLCRERSL